MFNSDNTEAYGNRAARLKLHMASQGQSMAGSEKVHLAKLAISEERKKKKRRRELANLIVDKMFALPIEERLEYLMSLPPDYPFNHINRRLLPRLFVMMRDRWFCPNKKRKPRG
jgi:hypothetical protein